MWFWLQTHGQKLEKRGKGAFFCVVRRTSHSVGELSRRAVLKAATESLFMLPRDSDARWRGRRSGHRRAAAHTRHRAGPARTNARLRFFASERERESARTRARARVRERETCCSARDTPPPHNHRTGLCESTPSLLNADSALRRNSSLETDILETSQQSLKIALGPLWAQERGCCTRVRRSGSHKIRILGPTRVWLFWTETRARHSK